MQINVLKCLSITSLRNTVWHVTFACRIIQMMVVGSITTSKASRIDGIPAEIFQILKDDAVKVLHSIGSKFGKLSSGHRTGRGQFSFQSQRSSVQFSSVQSLSRVRLFATP